MTSTKTLRDDSGPAFPVAEIRGPDGEGIREGRDGMSLRDWLAGQAIASMSVSIVTTERDAELMARSAYVIADAMLARRAAALLEKPE